MKEEGLGADLHDTVCFAYLAYQSLSFTAILTVVAIITATP
jgi:hypothetical protein